jgi:capsular polysaccharide biosynthesis protein
VDIWGAILVLARRFYITVPLAAASLIGAYAMASSVQPEYNATASVVLLGPTAPAPDRTAAPAPVNPYVSMSAATLTAAIQVSLTSTDSLAKLQAQHLSTNFSVTNVNRSTVIAFTATSSDPRQAAATANQLVNLMRSELSARQQPYTKNVSEQVTLQPLSTAAVAAPDTSSRTKAEAIAMGAAIVVTILLVLIIDAILASRKRRRDVTSHARTISSDAAQERTPVVRS